MCFSGGADDGGLTNMLGVGACELDNGVKSKEKEICFLVKLWT